MRSSTGFGARANPVYLVRRRPGCTDTIPRSTVLVYRHMSTVSGCVNGVADWMRSNRLQLNPEVHYQLALAPTSNRYTDSRFDDRRSGVLPVESDIVMRTHVCRTVSSCFAASLSVDSSRCRTQRRDWYCVSVDLTTSRNKDTDALVSLHWLPRF